MFNYVFVSNRNEGENLLAVKFDGPRYILEEGEVIAEEGRLQNERVAYREEIKEKMRKLIYLQNLQKQSGESMIYTCRTFRNV